MLITFLGLTIIVLLIMFGGLALNLSLYKRGGLNRGQQNSRKSSTTRLHEMLFMHY